MSNTKLTAKEFQDMRDACENWQANAPDQRTALSSWEVAIQWWEEYKQQGAGEDFNGLTPDAFKLIGRISNVQNALSDLLHGLAYGLNENKLETVKLDAVYWCERFANENKMQPLLEQASAGQREVKYVYEDNFGIHCSHPDWKIYYPSEYKFGLIRFDKEENNTLGFQSIDEANKWLQSQQPAQPKAVERILNSTEQEKAVERILQPKSPSAGVSKKDEITKHFKAGYAMAEWIFGKGEKPSFGTGLYDYLKSLPSPTQDSSQTDKGENK